MNSKEIAQRFGFSWIYIRKLTLKALESGKRFITLRGEKIAFSVTYTNTGRGGKTYSYTVVDESRLLKRKVKTQSIDMSELPRIDFAKVGLDEKLALVKFIKRTNTSIRSIVKAYEIAGEGKFGTLQKRVQRWVEAYERGGKKALLDKRGGKRVQKIDEELFYASLCKNANLWTYYARYAFLEAKRDKKAFNPFEPAKNCSITYGGFAKHFNKAKSDPHVKAILSGVDAMSELEPKFKIETNYPNEMWEIDATSLDVMVKVPVIDGEIEHFSKVESEEYVLKRYALVGVVDRHSKARVYMLNRSDTSYADVRLLEKAINRLGKPEFIRGDNGKNYVSNHFQEVLENLGIEYIASTPYKGSEKPFVERGFKSLQHSYLFESLPGYIGHNTEDRKAIENQAVGKKLKAKNGAGTQTNLKEKFLWWWEAEMVLDGLINHLFKEGMRLHNEMIQVSEPIAHLHILLGKTHIRTLQAEGVYFDKRYFINSELWNSFDVGEKVEIYEDIDDTNTIYAKTDKGFLSLTNREKVSFSVEEAKAIKKAYKDRKIKVLKEAVKKGKTAAFDISEEITKEAMRLSSLEAPAVARVIPSKKLKPANKKAKKAFDELMVKQGYVANG